MGNPILKGRCPALPFMMIGYLIVSFMNAVGKRKISFLLTFVRHIVLIIPIMLVMNRLWGINGMIWSLPVADLINAVIACLVFRKVYGGLELNKTS